MVFHFIFPTILYEDQVFHMPINTCNCWFLFVRLVLSYWPQMILWPQPHEQLEL